MLLATNALGTRVELALDAPETPALRAAGEAAIGEILHWHERLSRFLPHSLLSFINREAHARFVPLDDDVFALLDLCERVWRESGGVFDPTVGGDGAGWGALVALDRERRAVRLSHEGARLDLGGVAKGFALDRAAETLRAHCDCSALLHAGTSGVIAIGDTARRLGVRSATGVDELTIVNEAMCVSAPRGRTERGSGHIIDPSSGWSAHGADTALAVGPSCAEADAWATALVVLARRPERAPAHVRTATHDGRRWAMHGVHLSPVPEAA